MELEELLTEEDIAEAKKQRQREATARWRAKNPGKNAAYMRERRALDEMLYVKERQYDANRYWNDPEKARARAAAWKQANPDTAAAGRKAWWDANPGARNAARMRYHASKLRAIPAWANMDDIQIIYNFTKQLSLFTSEQYEVDHIVPLQSEIVCGLHVECNLRVIPATLNRKKQNFLLGEI